MSIAYFESLGRAWNRMRLALFNPFDLHKWFVIGFNVFLAGLTEGYHGSGGARYHENMNFREFLDFPDRAWQWLTNHPVLFMVIIFAGLVLIAIGIIFLWLSSRGTFMFLDNVVHNRAEVAKPWKLFRREGNSLFLWRLVFSLICIAIFISLTILFFVTGSSLYEESHGRHVPVAFIMSTALFALLIVVVIAYIATFLKHFVAPIMYKNNITTIQAWGRFLSLFGRYPFHFILYGILIFLSLILFMIIVIFAGILTCCIGWLVLVIPYIGTVVTLPFWYTLRAFSLEFLAQFGPDYELFPPAEPKPAVAQA